MSVGKSNSRGVIPDRGAVRKFDDGQTFVKDFEGTFLPFAGQDMPENTHRLSLTLCAEVSQGVLGIRGARKLTG